MQISKQQVIQVEGSLSKPKYSSSYSVQRFITKAPPRAWCLLAEPGTHTREEKKKSHRRGVGVVQEQEVQLYSSERRLNTIRPWSETPGGANTKSAIILSSLLLLFHNNNKKKHQFCTACKANAEVHDWICLMCKSSGHEDICCL